MFYNDFVTAKKSVKIKSPDHQSVLDKNIATSSNSAPNIVAEDFKNFQAEISRSLQEIKLECQDIREKFAIITARTNASKLAQDLDVFSEITKIKEELQKLQIEIQDLSKFGDNNGADKSLSRFCENGGEKNLSEFNKNGLEGNLSKYGENFGGKNLTDEISREKIFLEEPPKEQSEESLSGVNFSLEIPETVPDFAREKRSSSQVSFTTTGLRAAFSTATLNSLEVESLTKLEEEHQKFLSNKVEEIRGKMQLAIDGSSMQGKTIFEIADNIPTYKHSFAVQITNLMDAPLVDLESCDHGGVMNVPDVIPAREIHALTFGTLKGTNAWGVFTYRIDKTDIRLVVYYSAYSKTTIALAPVDVVIDHNLCIYMSKQDISDWSTRPDKRGARVSSKEVCLSVSANNFLARATISGRGKVLMKLEILKMETPALPPISFRNEDSGSESSLEEDNFKSSHGDVGYVIDITNSLEMDLAEPQSHLEDSSTEIPAIIGALRKRTLHFNIDSMDDMLVTYRIGSLDLRLAIAFGNDNQFSVALLPACIPTDSALLAAMCDSPQWKTRPDLKIGFSDDGETFVSVRNLRVTAAMTNSGKVPILKLSIISTR